MRRYGGLLTMLVAGLVPDAVAAIDLTGKWRVEGAPAQIIQMTQSGSMLSFTLSAISFSGTVGSSGAFTTFSVTGGSPGFMAGISGRVTPSGNLLLGRTVAGAPPTIFVGSLVATRCTCDDGNEVDGDGCDATCRVEPCWTCAGDPSVCTPASDG